MPALPDRQHESMVRDQQIAAQLTRLLDDTMDAVWRHYEAGRYDRALDLAAKALQAVMPEAPTTTREATSS